MPIWLGPPGGLEAFPRLRAGYDRTVERLGGTHELASGGLVQDVTGYRSSWTLTGGHISPSELSALLELYQAGRPVHLVDAAGGGNLLSAQQASGTERTRDPSGFVASTGTLTSRAGDAWQGSRALAWTVAGGTLDGHAVSTGAAPVYSSATEDDVVVPPLAGTPVSLAVRVRAVTGTVPVRLVVVWYSHTGAALGAHASPAVTPGAEWTTVSLANVAMPEGAAFARVRVALEEITRMLVTLLMDGWQWTLGAALGPWVSGIGTPLCWFDGPLEVAAPMPGRYTVTAALSTAGSG